MAGNQTNSRDTSLEDAMNTIARQALRITRLEDDNAALRAQLDDRAQTSVPACMSNAEGQDVHPAAVGMYTQDQYDSLEQRLRDVQSSFASLKSQHAGCEEMLKQYSAKCRQYKEWAKSWKEWKDKEEAKIKKMADLPPDQRAQILLTKKHHSGFDRPRSGSDDAPEPPLTPISLGEAGLEHRTRPESKTGSPAFPSSPPLLSDRVEPLPPSRSGIARVTSSQTTVDDTPTQAEITAPVELDASSDNEPVFVSARSLKRRNNAGPAERPTQRIKQEPNSPEAPIELNSSPRGTPERTVRHEISDLDVVGPRMITPRKPQRISELRERASSEEVARPRPSLVRNVSSYSEGDGGDSNLNDQRQDVFNKEDSRSVTRRQSHSNHQASEHGVLRPISVNVPTLARTSNRPPNGKSKVRRTGAKDVVRLLSEDGEEASQVPNDQTEEAQGNLLDDLLNEPPPQRTPVVTRRAQEPSTTGRKTRQAPHMPTPESIIKRPSPQKLRRSPAKRAREYRNSPPLVRPEHEPLRGKHLINLRPDDFKINPKYMGTTHAFTDTLRGRDARRGLHACTRPDCCGGALQKVITMGGTVMSGKTDAEALEAFLGPDWANHMGGYSPEKRKEITTQAHVFIFANEHGKHKAAFERRSTPPGFWDTDFPTTQQVEENRAKADEMQKKQTEERWREAMREGGRWLFRDE